MLTVKLGTCQMLADSLVIDSTKSITSDKSVLVKEDNATTDVNLWDEEW